MKIGAIADHLGTTVRTLRFYEEQGLIHPRRTPGGTRFYDEEDQARFAALLALTELGFPLQALIELAGTRACSGTGGEASAAVSAQLASMDRTLASKAAAIRKQRADIRRAQEFLSHCAGCRRRPTRASCDSCPISEGIEGIGVLRVVWDERPVD